MSKYNVNDTELLKAKQLLLHVESEIPDICTKIENSRIALEGQFGF